MDVGGNFTLLIGITYAQDRGIGEGTENVGGDIGMFDGYEEVG